MILHFQTRNVSVEIRFGLVTRSLADCKQLEEAAAGWMIGSKTHRASSIWIRLNRIQSNRIRNVEWILMDVQFSSLCLLRVLLPYNSKCCGFEIEIFVWNFKFVCFIYLWMDIERETTVGWENSIFHVFLVGKTLLFRIIRVESKCIILYMKWTCTSLNLMELIHSGDIVDVLWTNSFDVPD